MRLVRGRGGGDRTSSPTSPSIAASHDFPPPAPRSASIGNAEARSHPSSPPPSPHHAPPARGEGRGVSD